MNKVQLADAIINFYMANAKPCTVKELANFLGISEAKIRRVGSPDGRIDWTTEEIERINKDYGAVVGYAKASAWQPSRRTLRDMLVSTQRAAEAVIAELKEGKAS